jgi:hypothetical protein
MSDFNIVPSETGRVRKTGPMAIVGAIFLYPGVLGTVFLMSTPEVREFDHYRTIGLIISILAWIVGVALLKIQKNDLRNDPPNIIR